MFFRKEREMRAKGYRERYTYWGGPTYFEPDPTRRGIIPDEEWKARGYCWSEKYHRWHRPKKIKNEKLSVLRTNFTER
jgi:hypothetical protein